MKTLLRITFLLASFLIVGVTVTVAQRVIKGTVYMDGELAAGITVEANKGGEMMTSFDGVYEIEASAKTKWIKFTFIDDTKKLVIEGKPGNTFDFAFTGEIPSGDAEKETESVSLKSREELLKEKNRDYMNSLSLYREFYKQKDIKSAYPHWEKIYNKYPKASLNTYIHGAKIFETLKEKATNDTEKEEMFNNYMKLHDKRIKYFGQKGFVLGRKGTAWLKHNIEERELEGEEQIAALKTGYGWVNESADEQKAKTELPVLVLLMQTSKSLFKLGELPKETVVINYEKCSEFLNEIIANEKDNNKLIELNKVKIYIDDIFGKSGAADCEALVSIFTPKFNESANDVDYIKTMLRKLRVAKCDDTELYNNATERLYELEPSAEAAFNMAHRYLKRDDLEKAKEYYKQAMEQETDKDLLATYYYEYGLFVFAKENALSEARSYARKALSVKPDFCEANMLIGDIYLEATRSFKGTNLEKSAVFWVVVDYYNKARRGADCSIDASKKASKYKKYFPNNEEAFMEGLKEGTTYKVGGWINEKTKVRF